MKLIRPMAVTPSNLTSSSVAEGEPVWAVGTTYAEGAEVRGNTVDNEHLLFRSIQASNTGNALTDAAWWLEIGPTNRWKMFDRSVQSQTADDDEIEVVIEATERIDAVALLNVSGSMVQVVIDDPTDGVVFDETFDLISGEGIIDWYSYFFEPIVTVEDIVVTDLPPYSGSTMTVTITAPDGVARCGALIPGLSRQIGQTTYGANVGIIDYSRKERDQFGNDIVVERSFSKRGSFTVFMAPDMTVQAQRILAGFRATPIVYVGSDTYASTILYGYYRDFSIEIAGPNHSICSIEIEGLA